jgi:hypothetical protein
MSSSNEPTVMIVDDPAGTVIGAPKTDIPTTPEAPVIVIGTGPVLSNWMST